jgi:hypothetical protein
MEGERTTLQGLVDSMLEGMRDHRVAAVLGGGLRADVDAALDAGFVDALRERLGDEAGLLDGMPPEAAAHGESAVDWVRDEGPEAAPKVAEAVAAVLGAFVAARRDDVLAAIRAAGEEPGKDRQARLASAAEGAARAAAATVAVGALPPSAEEEAIDALVDPAVASLEAAREHLEEVALDDGLLGVPEGTVPARDLLRGAWMAEVDLYEAAASRVGPPVTGIEAGTYEQEAYLLDAIVALQEALTMEADRPGLLRLARLRLAKNDVGEARAIAARVLEMDPDDAQRAEAEGLLAAAGGPGSGAKDRRCFVATAALSVDAPEVEALRAWRDAALMPHRAGRWLVSAYYRLSPPLARAIAGRSWLRRAVREGLVRPAARLAARRPL